MRFLEAIVGQKCGFFCVLRQMRGFGHARIEGSLLDNCFYVLLVTLLMVFARLAGSGIFAPSGVVESREFEVQYGLEEGWVERRTGIRKRRYCEQGEDILTMVSAASGAAVQSAGAGTIDSFFVAKDHTLGTRDASLARGLYERLKRLDLSCALEGGYFEDGLCYCSGFLSGLQHGRARIEAGESQGALVAGFSRASEYIYLVDKTRETDVLWGDGAGAVVLEPADAPGILLYTERFLPEGKGCFTEERLADGRPYLGMDGSRVIRIVARSLPKLIRETVEEAGYRLEDIGLYILHQANGPLLQIVRGRLGVPEERFFVNIGMWGNTIPATIPIAYHEARSAGKLPGGSLAVFAGFGPLQERGEQGMHANALVFRA